MDRSPERLLDAALPRWDRTERHAPVVPAPPDEVWRALHEVSMRDLPVTRRLMRVRTAGRSKGGRDRLVLDALPSGELARRAPHEPLLGLVAPTSLRVDVRSVARRAEAADG
jgi:hypothetical protein